MASFVYTTSKLKLGNGVWDLDNPTTNEFNTMLVVAASTAETASSQDATTIAGFSTKGEFSGTGYTAGGERLTNRALTQSNGGNLAILDGDDITWTAVSAGNGPIVGAVVYKVSGTVSQGIPVAWISFASSITANGGDITIQWAAGGVLQVT